MAWSGKFRKIDDNRWEISKEHMPCMRTDAVIFSNESMLDSIMDDNSPQQVANVACLPGIVGRSLAMPDIHFGYGFPIGVSLPSMLIRDPSPLAVSVSTSIAVSVP